jgi:hypothetical protein
LLRPGFRLALGENRREMLKGDALELLFEVGNLCNGPRRCDYQASLPGLAFLLQCSLPDPG